MKASLRVQPGIQEELTEVSISTICLSEGKELETWLTARPDEKFEVLSHESMADGLYSYILFDHRDGAVYAVQSIDLEFHNEEDPIIHNKDLDGCPYCGSADLEVDNQEHYEETIEQRITCKTCAGVYDLVWPFVGYREIKKTVMGTYRAVFVHRGYFIQEIAADNFEDAVKHAKEMNPDPNDYEVEYDTQADLDEVRGPMNADGDFPISRRF